MLSAKMDITRDRREDKEKMYYVLTQLRMDSCVVPGMARKNDSKKFGCCWIKKVCGPRQAEKKMPRNLMM